MIPRTGYQQALQRALGRSASSLPGDLPSRVTSSDCRNKVA